MLGSISELITAAQGSLADAVASSTDLSDLGFSSLQDIIGTGD